MTTSPLSQTLTLSRRSCLHFTKRGTACKFTLQKAVVRHHIDHFLCVTQLIPAAGRDLSVVWQLMQALCPHKSWIHPKLLALIRAVVFIEVSDCCIKSPRSAPRRCLSPPPPKMPALFGPKCSVSVIKHRDFSCHFG